MPLALVLALLALALLPTAEALRFVVVAPWVEETVFRWGLQDGLARRLGPARPWAPVLLSALCFGLAHLALAPPGQAPAWALATALPALWIGWRYRCGGGLAGCVAWHSAFNLAWLLVLQPFVLPFFFNTGKLSP